MFDSLLMRLFPDLTFTEQQAVNWIESHSDLQGLQLEIKRASGWELWAGELLVANRDCLLAGQSSGAVLRFERESKKCAAVYDAEGLAEAVALQEAGLIDGDIVLLLPADWQQAVKAVNETSSWVMSVAEDALTAGRGETSRQLESLLAYCDQNAVSDCHLTAGQNALQVSVRSQGLLRPYLKLDRCSGLGLCRALRQRAGLNLETLTMPIDGTLKAFGKKIRLAATPSIAGESVTLRWPGKKSAVRSPDELGLSDTQIELVTSSVGRKLNGLVIVSGGVGAGKTTTLYFLMRFLGYGKRIVTLEDPVECWEREWTQMDMSTISAKNRHAFLRAALRQSPDWLMIGELRDTEGVQLALSAVSTGHKVWTSLHLTSANMLGPRLQSLGCGVNALENLNVLHIHQSWCSGDTPTQNRKVKFEIDVIDTSPIQEILP